MTNHRTRLILLHALSDGKMWSSAALSDEARCSRRTVWRAIRELRLDGYPIRSGQGKGSGYMMKPTRIDPIDDYDNHGFWKEDHHREEIDA